MADFNGGTVDGCKPNGSLFSEISQVGIGLSPSVPVLHAVDFRGKIVPYARCSVAWKEEQDPAIAEIDWPIPLAHSGITSVIT
jgi:hypothetical protein